MNMARDAIASKNHSFLPQIECSPVSSIMARFKHISERCRTDASGTIVKEYIVQVYGTTHGGRHASLDAAKKTLRKVAAKKTQWLRGERGRCTKNNDNKWVLAPMARKKKKHQSATGQPHSRLELPHRHPALGGQSNSPGRDL